LTRRVALLPAGSKAEFTILRDGRKESLTTTISTRNEKTASADTGRRAGTARPSDSMLGMELGPVTRREGGTDNSAKGVVVTSIDPTSDAADKGIQTGNVIVKIGNKDVHAPADVRRLVTEAKTAGRNRIMMLVDGMQGEHFVAVKIA
jgi:serine protease Do